MCITLIVAMRFEKFVKGMPLFVGMLTLSISPAVDKDCIDAVQHKSHAHEHDHADFHKLLHNTQTPKQQQVLPAPHLGTAPKPHPKL